MKKQTTRSIRRFKYIPGSNYPLQMLTAYDYQTATLLDETELDLILVGDSLGNVILGMEHTVGVTVEMMQLFGRAVRLGAPHKFVVVDLPFGSYATLDRAIDNSIELFQKTECDALKLEGASPLNLDIIRRLTEIGIPVMGHIGLVPQSVHQLGGYFMQGKDEDSSKALEEDAYRLQEAGCFALVLECTEHQLSSRITKNLRIPTIGIGSGDQTDGQVLVINDLLRMGKKAPPSFCLPVANLYETKRDLIQTYLHKARTHGPTLHS